MCADTADTADTWGETERYRSLHELKDFPPNERNTSFALALCPGGRTYVTQTYQINSIIPDVYLVQDNHMLGVFYLSISCSTIPPSYSTLIALGLPSNHASREESAYVCNQAVKSHNMNCQLERSSLLISHPR